MALSYREGGDFIIIRQDRPGQPIQKHRLTETSRKIYLACRTPISINSLLNEFNSVTEKALRMFLNDLEEKKLVYSNHDQYLALAVQQSEHSN